jgi:hypothetical protein
LSKCALPVGKGDEIEREMEAGASLNEMPYHCDMRALDKWYIDVRIKIEVPKSVW